MTCHVTAATADAQVHACVTRSGRDWAALRAGWRVAEATLALLRRRIETGAIRVWRDWEDGSGAPTRAGWEAARRLVNACGDPGGPGGAFAPNPAGPPPRFVVRVRPEDGVPELLEEGGL